MHTAREQYYTQTHTQTEQHTHTSHTWLLLAANSALLLCGTIPMELCAMGSMRTNIDDCVCENCAGVLCRLSMLGRLYEFPGGVVGV